MQVDGEAIEKALTQLEGVELNREDVADIVSAFGRHIGAEGLHLDEAGSAWLTVDGTLEICLFHLPGFPGIVAGARLPAAAHDHAQVLRSLLRANASWAENPGCSFGLVPPSDEPMLCQMIPLLDADAVDLDRDVAAFVALADSWHRKIKSKLDDEPTSSKPDRSSDLTTMIRV
ncbi:MAG: type III secretion system chaperone [Pseudomonadota bacterium]